MLSISPWDLEDFFELGYSFIPVAGSVSRKLADMPPNGFLSFLGLGCWERWTGEDRLAGEVSPPLLTLVETTGCDRMGGEVAQVDGVVPGDSGPPEGPSVSFGLER